MSLTSPWKQHNYIGQYANDAAADAFVTLAAWPGSKAGLEYFNTTSSKLRIHDGTSWADVGGTAPVTSVFGRTGAVVAVSGDYTATQVTNSPAGGVAATTVQAAINELDTEKVSGPASVTTLTVARYDGTTGKLLKGSLVTLDDSGNISMSSNADITVTGGGELLGLPATPSGATAATSKAYVDNLVSGIDWKDAVTTLGLIGNRTVVQLNGITATAGDAYVVTSAGTLTQGTPDLVVAIGDLVEYDGTKWSTLAANSGGFVPLGVRAVLSTDVALLAPYTDTTNDGMIVSFSGASNTGTSTGEAVDKSAVLVKSFDITPAAYWENNGFVFSGTVPTGSWVMFSGAGQINAGDGLDKTGNTLNVDTTVVRTNGANPFTSSQSMGGNNLTQLSTSNNSSALPTFPVDFQAANCESIDAADVRKPDVDAATADVLANGFVFSPGTGSQGADQLTFTSTPVIDGFSSWISGSHILVKDQADGAQNGLYMMTSSDLLWTRAPWARLDADFTRGIVVRVLNGTKNAKSTFAMTNTGVVTANSTSLTFEPETLATKTGSSSPNSGGGTPGYISQIFVDTNAAVIYMNIDGTDTGWVVI